MEKGNQNYGNALMLNLSFEDCQLTQLRQSILGADLVVTNHALLLANQELKDSALGHRRLLQVNYI